jgi:adenosylcobinamide-GDP ribazoletransferase
LEKLGDKYWFALRFFTRLPISFSKSSDTNLASAAIAFPLAGLTIGLICALVWLVFALFLPPLSAAGLTILCGLLLTGALHEDGFSDCADGLGGGFTKDRALEIMRDSRIGAYGACALIVTIGLRWTGLASFSLLDGALALVIAHMTGRAAITIALAYSSYARESGLGKSVSNGIEEQDFWFIFLITALLAFALGWFAGLFACLVGFAAAWAFLKYLEKRLDGYTGDGLGSMEQCAEIAALLTLLVFWT